MRDRFDTEASLIECLVAGDRSAFEHVYRKHNSSLIRVGAGIVQSRATAEEVAQDTWIAVLKNYSHLRTAVIPGRMDFLDPDQQGQDPSAGAGRTCPNSGRN
jgi:hypothetical protein